MRNAGGGNGSLAAGVRRARVHGLDAAAGVALLVGSLAAACAAPADPARTHAPGPPWEIGVLVLEFYPLTSDGTRLDLAVTGDVGDPAATVRARVAAMTARLPRLLSDATRYRGHADPSAAPSLTYRVVDTRRFDRPVPAIPSSLNPAYTVRPDYRTILDGVGICDYVRGRGVREVWMWSYHGPHQLDISESKMSGPQGDVSNSYRRDDMPDCGRTYTVYTFNYGRSVALAVHTYGHQLETELTYMDEHLFRDVFEGPPHPATAGVAGRCGSDHNPPNARFEYDWSNPAANASDCEDWNPDGIGTLQAMGCATWSCAADGEEDAAQLHWLVRWMQHFPGAGNRLTYQGRPMRNWWSVHADFDAAVSAGRVLTEADARPGPAG